jgi:hypothetical protein
MNTYTKAQIEYSSLNAKELLLSWTSGQGATGKTPELYTHVKSGAIRNQPVSVALLTALAEMYLTKSKVGDATIKAIGQGYLSINHLDEYKEETKVEKALPGHYLTASEYLQSCFDKLPSLEQPSLEDVLNILHQADIKKDKQFLMSTILEAIDAGKPKEYSYFDLSAEQQEKYNELQTKEMALNNARANLESILTEITFTSDTTVKGRFYPSPSKGVMLKEILDSTGYEILVSSPVAAKLDDTFNIVEDGYVLMTIKVTV